MCGPKTSQPKAKGHGIGMGPDGAMVVGQARRVVGSSCLLVLSGTRRPRAGPCASFLESVCLFSSRLLRLSWLILSPVHPPTRPLSQEGRSSFPLPRHTSPPSPRQRLSSPQAPRTPDNTRHHEPPTPSPPTSPPRPASSLLLRLNHGKHPPRMRALLCQHGPPTQGQHPRHPDKPRQQQQQQQCLRWTHCLL